MSILKDMELHFAQKLRTQIADIAGTCKMADLDSTDTVGIVMAAMMYELIRASQVLGWDEKQFLMMCKVAYKQMKPIVRQEYENP